MLNDNVVRLRVHDDDEALIANLRARKVFRQYEDGSSITEIRNPDGELAADRLEELLTAARNILPYLEYTIGDESPGYHPTMPSAVAAFKDAFDGKSYDSK